MDACPSRTLLGNGQIAVCLGMPDKDTKSPLILISLTSGGHIDLRMKRQLGKQSAARASIHKSLLSLDFGHPRDRLDSVLWYRVDNVFLDARNNHETIDHGVRCQFDK